MKDRSCIFHGDDLLYGWLTGALIEYHERTYLKTGGLFYLKEH
ncbi:hypothetical protein [Heyndrickxia ginsengihumi]|nr:hypothetical protein [Heyndrickxia ginsengihumi]